MLGGVRWKHPQAASGLRRLLAAVEPIHLDPTTERAERKAIDS